MSSLKLDQIEVVNKDLYKQRQETDTLTIDVKKDLLFDKVSCNDEKRWRYIIGCQVDGEKIKPLLTITLKTYLV